MKLLIDIDEDRYDKNYLLVRNGMGDDVHRAVANGTPIPDNPLEILKAFVKNYYTKAESEESNER